MKKKNVDYTQAFGANTVPLSRGITKQSYMYRHNRPIAALM